VFSVEKTSPGELRIRLMKELEAFGEIRGETSGEIRAEF
jgi:hypothetical protein